MTNVHAPAILEARALTAGYGPMAVVRDIDLHVSAGEMVALLGPNGAGKTTTLAAMTARMAPMSGEVRWEGEPIDCSHHRLARRGMSFVAERSVFSGLSALENLRLGAGDPDSALRLFPELRPLLGQRAGLLSGGEQQILAMARALATDPKVLVVDELSLGLAPQIVDRLLCAIRGAADRGVAVLLVEQHAARVLEVADRAYLMCRGRIEATGPANEVSGAAIRRAYLA